MGGCLSVEEFSPRNHLIIDVQQIIADDAWEEFVISSQRGCRFRRMRMKRSDYTIEVPMNYYHFEVTKQTFNLKKSIPSQQSSDVVTAKRSTSQAQAERVSPDQLGLKTEFRNDTDQNQTYNFRMEKTRKATMHVSYQKGFSIGGSASFTLGLPKVLESGELSTEISATYEVTNSRGQTFEESMTTEATSEIVVSSNHHCTAQVVMQERRLLADFMVWVLMRMPEKRAVVEIKDREGRLVFLKEIVNLSQLFPHHTHVTEDGATRADVLQFVVHGVVDGVQLDNHYIHLKSRKLPVKPKTAQKQRPPATADDSGARQVDVVEFKDLEEMGYNPGF